MAKNEEKIVEEAAENESDVNWLWKLSKPITYNGEEISELRFNFEKITGRDAIEIENELQSTGKLSLYSPISNIHYLTRVAARACEKPIGADLFDMASIRDFNILRNHVQIFLINVPS